MSVDYEKLYQVKLSFDELYRLNGHVREEVQKIIDEALLANSFPFPLGIMGEILVNSQKNGTLTWRYKDISECKYCDKKRQYYTYTRSSRNHRKGETNYSSPKYHRGIKFNEGFVTIQGLGDLCVDCCTKHSVIETMVSYIVTNDLPIQIQTNDYYETKYIKDPILICFKCNLEMQESKMGRSPTWLGNGSYPSTCPHCSANSTAFGSHHKTTSKFVMLKADQNNA